MTIREDATPAERENAERSVATLVERSAATVARARAAEAELAVLTDAIDRPFARLIEEDSLAKEALETLRTRDLMETEAMDVLQREAPQVRELDGMPLPQHGPAVTRSLGFVPPYDFSWSWHDQNGHAPFNRVLERPSGAVGLDARSGSLTGGASGFVNAHAGFGVFLQTNVTAQKFPHAVLNPGRFSHAMKTIGLGSNATSEGGFELTVFEDGQFLIGASRKLWRMRISQNESSSGGQGNHAITGPELAFTMHAGRGYTFNAGIWVYSDRTNAIGSAAVQSLLQGVITRMWVFG